MFAFDSTILSLFILATLTGIAIGLAQRKRKRSKELLPFKNYNEQEALSEPTNPTEPEKISNTSVDAIWN